MSPNEAVANIFLTAFHALSHVEQDAILAKLVKDEEVREDLIDLAIAETKHRERPRSFRKFFENIKRERRLHS